MRYLGVRKKSLSRRDLVLMVERGVPSCCFPAVRLVMTQKSECLSGSGSLLQTHLLTLSMDSGSGGGMEKQAEGASWTTPVLLWTTHISGLLLSFRVYLSPLVSCTWERTQNSVKGLDFWL